MSMKIAAESFRVPLLEVVVREYDEERDKAAVEELETRCEVGQQGKLSLLTDLMGDPICRIRNFPLHVMLVAVYREETELVGVIRGSIKTVTSGKEASNGVPVYEKLAYILGLRVSPTHRRLGIATKLVQHLEEWCNQNGADYSYMATDTTNEASIKLFTKKCNYLKFRTPTLLVHPVHAHYKPLSSGTTVVRVSPQLTESIYRQVFTNSEFFPKDIDQILCNKLNLGTFMAMPKLSLPKWDPMSGTLPSSFAILSVWNTKEVFKLQVKGVSRLTCACFAGSRVLDNLMPWLNIPSIPNFFRPFGVYLLFGLFMEGKGASRLMKSLCAFVHNMARDDDGCGAVVAEVGQRDPVRKAVPHWRKFSWAEDLWYVKKLAPAKREEDGGCGPSDWIKSQSCSSVIFVDPRDF
ncbi:N-acetyltransferase HLS1-like [Actinidia chinensis var. chinensis]|uniref:N-acetyltransferase HLS1-like n=1 Tax=Actinidia chinensis var. chinensis TaxID=1590841 RepID=A0A2R6PDD0_ACTCC|nr:N-acetyltransferase HLS1-like [Actinidia chinensis var. chinensis]